MVTTIVTIVTIVTTIVTNNLWVSLKKSLTTICPHTEITHVL
jgi:ABC-type lipoprotein release transport system permease subunit